ncbi:DUF2442 domain-containing protein [Endozoicomonadaceae bacterium StTr2]
MGEVTISSVRHIKDYILELIFSDGHTQRIDFAPFIFLSGHPVIEAYQDMGRFLGYKLLDGNLNWDDYNMIFPVKDLYKDRLRPLGACRDHDSA